MIETKEQYERAMGKRIPLGLGTTIPVDMMDDIKETIEALREVAREANLVVNGKMVGKTVAEVRMKQALAALPDWITE